MIHYEDHCKAANTFRQSDNYISRIIPEIFSSVQRTRVHRNGKKYQGFTGIREVDPLSPKPPLEAATVHSDEQGNTAIAVPSMFQRDEQQIFIVTTLRSEGAMTIGVTDGVKTDRIEGKILDLPPTCTVSRPEIAIPMICKNIRLCRGVETTEQTGERWTSLIDRSPQVCIYGFKDPKHDRPIIYQSSVKNRIRILYNHENRTQENVQLI